VNDCSQFQFRFDLFCSVPFRSLFPSFTGKICWVSLVRMKERERRKYGKARKERGGGGDARAGGGGCKQELIYADIFSLLFT